ncbi:hypothetical protein [Fusibacter bizertensis]
MQERINENHLNLIAQDKDSKAKSSVDCDITMLQLFYTKKNIFYHIKEKMKLYELSLWLKAMKNYLDRKTDYHSVLYAQKRSIMYIDFGFGIGNELAYEHPCIVIDFQYDNMFVVPCSTGQLKRAKNDDGTTKDGYMITDGTNGFTRETALILHGSRWVSKRRIVRDTRKKVTNAFFNELKRELLKITLGSELHYINELESKVKKQDLIIKTAIDELDKYVEIIKALEKQNEELVLKTEN